MKISKCRIRNYKSFWDSGDIELAPGFNIILGKNDSGKTALVESLRGNCSQNPHRSAETLPAVDTPVNGQAVCDIEFSLLPDEFSRFLSHTPNLVFRGVNSTVEAAVESVATYASRGGRVACTWSDNSLTQVGIDGVLASGQLEVVRFRNQDFPHGVRLSFVGSGTANHFDLTAAAIGERCKSLIYVFRAERLNVGSCAALGSTTLNNDASNLSDVLDQLSKNPERYRVFLSHVTTIFPHITYVSARLQQGGGMVRTEIWSHPIGSQRIDLAVPLSESGTGIGQVLAILYVVVTADSPRVIVIDEPQSFLHPGAFRKLLEILRVEYSQHQYVFTSHLPLALTGDDDAVLWVRREGEESKVERIDPKAERELRVALGDIGARLSDTFGADSILWVEGKTEETCFPMLIREVARLPLLGVQVVGVVSTDELTNKHAERVFDIYAKLTSGNALLPQATAFVFDREERTDAQRSELDRRSGGKMYWLPFRMYENYLIEPDALAALINAEDAGRDEPLTSGEIVDWLNLEGANPKYHSPHDPCARPSQVWQRQVHGGKLLTDMFNKLTDARVPYAKVRHGEALTRTLIRNPPPDLSDLATMLAGLVRQSVPKA